MGTGSLYNVRQEVEVRSPDTTLEALILTNYYTVLRSLTSKGLSSTHHLLDAAAQARRQVWA